MSQKMLSSVHFVNEILILQSTSKLHSINLVLNCEMSEANSTSSTNKFFH